MEWPEELLRIFEDQLFANVHPRAPKPTTEDVVREGALGRFVSGAMSITTGLREWIRRIVKNGCWPSA